jgi:FkbM family methyltransferase
MMFDFKSIIDKYNMKINGVLHIGAHHGQEHSRYKDNNVSKIVYFEPLKSNFEVLKSRINDDSILHNIALGSENKEVEMFVETANNGQSSSILEPGLHLSQYPHITFDSKEVVNMKRLDDVIDNTNKDYNFICIDVQGYELEVFKGSTKTLENIDYIVTEINNDEVYKNCTKIGELSEFLGKYGFVLVEEDWCGHTWGDGLFVKQ